MGGVALRDESRLVGSCLYATNFINGETVENGQKAFVSQKELSERSYLRDQDPCLAHDPCIRCDESRRHEHQSVFAKNRLHGEGENALGRSCGFWIFFSFWAEIESGNGYSSSDFGSCYGEKRLCRCSFAPYRSSW